MAKVLELCELGGGKEMGYYLRMLFSWNLTTEHKEMFRRGLLSLLAARAQANE
jgi:hypothetical protein